MEPLWGTRRQVRTPGPSPPPVLQLATAMTDEPRRVRTDGLILAAGSGDRFGGTTPKAFVPLGGEAMLVRAARAAAAAGIEDLVVVVPAAMVEQAVALLGAAAGGGLAGARVVPGGASRVESCRLGLAALEGADEDVVVVHDAARPLATAETFRRVVGAVASGADAATATIPSADTVAFVADGKVVEVPPRERVVRVQTPQAFRREILRRAHAAAAAAGDTSATDDCGLVLAYLPGARVAAVPGDDANVKVTTAADLRIADELARGN